VEDLRASPAVRSHAPYYSSAPRNVGFVPDLVVLLGAPGSGKTTIGEELGRLGLRWREWETVIVERWGSRERFLSIKADALPLLHREQLDFIDAPGAPAVFETTGLSDADFLDRLVESRRVLVVRLDVSEAQAMRRITERERGRHLTDDVEASRAVWRAFHEHVAPRRHADLVIDTEHTAPAVAAATIAATRL
jgi:shikimate kinase